MAYIRRLVYLRIMRPNLLLILLYSFLFVGALAPDVVHAQASPPSDADATPKARAKALVKQGNKVLYSDHHRADSLLQLGLSVGRAAKSDSVIAGAHLHLMRLRKLQGRFQAAETHFMQMKPFAYRAQTPKLLAFGYGLLALTYVKSGQDQRALQTADSAWAAMALTQSSAHKAYVAAHVADVYADLNLTEAAISTHQYGVYHFYRAGDYVNAAQAASNLGYYLLDLNLHERARPYIFGAFEVVQAKGRPGSEMTGYGQIASYYDTADQPDSMAHYSRLALQAAQKHQNPYFEAIFEGMLGEYRLQRGELSQAQDYLEAAADKLEAIPAPNVQLTTLAHLLEVYLAQAQLPLAKPLQPQIEALLTPQRPLKNQIEAHTQLAGLMMATGDYKSAYAHRDRAAVLTDSLRDEDQLALIGKKEAEAEQAIARIRREQQIAAAEARLEAERQWQFLLIFGGLGSLLTGLMFIRALRIPPRVRQLAFLFSLILLFEALILYLDPYIIGISGELPIPNMLANGILAVIIMFAFEHIEQLYVRRQKPRAERATPAPTPGDAAPAEADRSEALTASKAEA